MGYILLIKGVYWGYNPLTNHLLTSWDIQVVDTLPKNDMGPETNCKKNLKIYRWSSTRSNDRIPTIIFQVLC